jgi:hypothetical protein
MNITIITPPPFEPLSREDVYNQLRLDAEGSPLSHPDDALIDSYITTGREFVEKSTRRSLVQRTLRLSAAGFPVCVSPWVYQRSLLPMRFQPPQHIYLPRPPIVSVTSVKYFDIDNTLQTVDSSDYYLTDDEVPELRFVRNFSAPTTYDRPDALRVEYVAGYAPAGSPPSSRADYVVNVPQSLVNAILASVTLLYDSLPPANMEALSNMREAYMSPFRVQLSV